MTMLRFEDPWFLLLLVPAVLLALRPVSRSLRPGGAVRYSGFDLLRRAGAEKTARRRHLLLAMRLTAVVALVAAMARPQSGASNYSVRTEGVDIILAMDISSSMLAEDLSPNRLEAAKQVASSFVRARPDDRIGLVVFGGEAFTQAPPTLDQNALEFLLAELDVSMAPDGTAIGLGLATALKRLENSTGESRLVLLLTDGQNNRGEIDPRTAAQAAQALGVRVYTIGAGSDGPARIPVDDLVFGRRYVTGNFQIDEETLRDVAEITGGQYFRATDNQSLARIYAEIDQLETSEADTEIYTVYAELFHFPLAAGLFLLTGAVLLGQTFLRRLP